MRVLKTTQSGYEGFLHDKYTILKDTSERMMASSVTATWRQVLWLALCPLGCLDGIVCDRHLPMVCLVAALFSGSGSKPPRRGKSWESPLTTSAL